MIGPVRYRDPNSLTFTIVFICACVVRIAIPMARLITGCTTCLRGITRYLLSPSSTAPGARLGTSRLLVLKARCGPRRWPRFSLRSAGTSTPTTPCPPSFPLSFLFHKSAHAMFLRIHRPRHRKFTASDGREYSWSWRTSTQEDLEWSVSITYVYFERAVFEQSGGFTVRQRERTYCCMVCGFIRLYVRCGGAVPPSRSR